MELFSIRIQRTFQLVSTTHENITDKPLNPIEFDVTNVEDWNETDIDQELDVPTTQSGN